MSQMRDKERAMRNIVRLRRASRELARNDDLEAARADLEGVVGPTVNRAAAARLLGVSQTALDRWIARGQIPAVLTPEGRRAVPRNALVELMLEAEAEAESGDRLPLAAVLRRRRSAAGQIDLGTVLPPRGRRGSRRHGHRAAEIRSLAYHRAVARKLDAPTIDAARDRLRRWRSEGRIAPPPADRWEEILSWPTARVAKFIASDTADAIELRQSSPFAGSLTEPERRRVLEAVESALDAR